MHLVNARTSESVASSVEIAGTRTREAARTARPRGPRRRVGHAAAVVLRRPHGGHALRDRRGFPRRRRARPQDRAQPSAVADRRRAGAATTIELAAGGLDASSGPRRRRAPGRAGASCVVWQPTRRWTPGGSSRSARRFTNLLPLQGTWQKLKVTETNDVEWAIVGWQSLA